MVLSKIEKSDIATELRKWQVKKWWVGPMLDQELCQEWAIIRLLPSGEQGSYDFTTVRM